MFARDVSQALDAAGVMYCVVGGRVVSLPDLVALKRAADLPDPHFVLSTLSQGRERTLGAWAPFFDRVWDRDPIGSLPSTSAPRLLRSWIDANAGGAIDGEPLVVHDVSALIDHLRAHEPCREGIDEAFGADVERFATRLCEYLVRASVARVPVRVIYI